MMMFFSLLLGACLVAMSEMTGHIDIYVMLAILLFSGGFFFDISRRPSYRKYSVPLALGYFFRIGLLFYDVYTNNPLRLPLVGGALSSDPLRFYNAAIGYTQGIQTSYGGFFPRMLGAIFSVTGISRLWAEFIVFIFSIFTILVFVKIVDGLEVPIAYRKKGTYLICLLPNFAFLSAVLRRETVITFFIALSVKYFVEWLRDNGGNKSFVLAFVFALSASLFHGATGLIAIAYIFIRIIYSPTRKSFILEAKNILGALVFAALFMFVYARFGTVFFGKIESKLSAGVYSSIRDAGGSSYARYVGDARTPVRMLIYAIPRFMYFMFSPFPWQWRGLGDIITFIFSSCVYLYIILTTLRYIRLTPKDDENRKILIALLVITLLCAAVFSWGVTNTGTATRHRDKFIVLFALMYTLSQEKRIRINVSPNSRRF